MLKLSKITIPYTSLRLNLMVVCEMVLLLLLSLGVMLYFSRQALVEEAQGNAIQTLESTEQHIDNILMTVEQTTYNIYQDIQWHLDQPDRMFTYCRSIVETYPYIVGCNIAFEPNYYPGRELFMAYVHRADYKQGNNSLVTAETFGNQPYTEQLWYKLPMSSKRACWTDPLPEEENEGVTLSFCLPIVNSRAECVGVIAVDLPISLLSQIVHSVKPSPNSYCVLLSNNGSYIVHIDAKKLSGTKTVWEFADKNEDPSVREAAKAVVSGETGFKTFQMSNKEWYVFYKPFRHTAMIDRPMDQIEWSASVVYLKDDILGNYDFLIYLVLAITIVGILFFVVLCRLVVRRQMLPLRMLTRSAHRVAEGNYTETVPKAQRDDEIGQLQDLFRRMQQSLAAKSTELEQLTKRLTKRSEELRKALGNAQGSDRMKTTFLHYMTTQMTVPSDLIERSVMKLGNNYETISPQEADFEVSVIKEQSEKIIDLLDHMVEALKIEAEEAEKAVKERKEVSHDE